MERLTRAAFEALLVQDPDQLFARFEALCTQIESLEARLAALEAQVRGTSRNSHRPPSSDPPGTAGPGRGRPPSGRTPGGQPGHPGRTVRFVEPPDRVETHRPTACPGCGHTLPVEAVELGYERRQVIELPPRLVEVTEHRAIRVVCPDCGAATTGPFPADVTAPVQYGPRLKGLGVYLLTYQLVPNQRTADLLDDLLGVSLAVGTLQTAVTDGAATLAEPEAQIIEALTQAEVLHCDETGISLGGRGAWLHVVATDRLTHYAPHRKRGAEATAAIGVLPRAQGVLVHDAWAPYWHYPNQHALCNAHHLRELTAVEEQTGQPWAAQLRTLLVQLKTHIAEAQAAGATAICPEARQAFLAQYTALLDAGDQLNPPVPPVPGRRGRTKQSKTRNLLDRLRQRQREVLAFMDDWRIPFDNNQAERDLRMVKVQQKISGTFRRDAGARAFCRWRGYLATLRKHGLPLLDAITQTLSGHPPLPQLAT